MAKQRIKQPGNYSPSANRKIVQVTQKQGVSGIQNMQGTTRIILDAVQLQASSTKTTINLFEDCSKRSFPLTNLSENKLQVGETIAVQRFSLYIIETLAATGQAVAVVPLDYFAEFKRIYASFLSFSIAQDQVIKKLPLSSMYAPFNPYSRFMGQFQLQPAGGDLTTLSLPHDVYHMETDLIIPPQIEFIAQVELPAIGLPTGSTYNFHLAMKIEGIGSLYAPKGNY